MTRPTVAHVKDRFLPRSETFIYTLLRGLRRYRGLVIDRHARQNATLFPWPDYISPVARWGPWAGWLERLSLRLWGRSPYLERALRREGVLLMHAHFGQLGALFVPVARRLGLPLVTSFYGADLSRFATDPAWHPRFQALWAYGSRFLVLGPHMADRLRALGCPAERITVLPLPLDLGRLPKVERRPPGAGEPVYLLTAGRLVPKKGVDILLHALARLHTPRVHLWIVGDGPERDRLERLAAQLGLHDRVTFWGWLSHADLLTRMAQAHMFVLASRADPQTGETEGTPTVLLEAQALGLPVVSTRHADIPYIVQHGVSGILVPAGDAASLAEALDILLRRPDRWPTMGAAGRAYVAAHHDVRHVAARLETMYDEVRQNGGKP